MNAIFDLLMLMVNHSATLKVTVILNKRRYQSINQVKVQARLQCSICPVHRYSSQHIHEDATH